MPKRTKKNITTFQKTTINSTLPPTQEGISLGQVLFEHKDFNMTISSTQYRDFVKKRIQNSKFLNFEELANLKIDENELTFAFVGPMIGAMGFYSHEIIAGILAHFEEINRENNILGFRLRLLIVNDYNDPEQTNKIVNYLVNTHKIYFFVGGASDEGLFSIYSLIKDKSITTLFPNTKNKFFLSPYNKHIINGANNEELLVDKILDFTIHNLGLKKRIGVFYPDNEVGRYLASYIKNKLDVMKLPPAYFVFFDPLNPKYLGASKLLLDFEPEVIISLGNYISSARLGSYFLLQNQIQTVLIGTTEMFFATKILEDFLFSGESKSGSLKMFYTSFFPDLKAEEYSIVHNYQESLKNIESAFCEDKICYPSPLGLNYYICAKILILALKEALSLNPNTSFYSSDFQKHLLFRMENMKDLDIGGFLIGFNSTNRCACYLEPHVTAAIKN